MERSFWLNASLAVPRLGYWGAGFAPPQAPSTEEVGRAARVLLEQARPNRLYLIHHRELPFAEITRVFRDWRRACPASVEIVPALVLRMYDKEAAPVFSDSELEALVSKADAKAKADAQATQSPTPPKPGEETARAMKVLAAETKTGANNKEVQQAVEEVNQAADKAVTKASTLLK